MPELKHNIHRISGSKPSSHHVKSFDILPYWSHVYILAATKIHLRPNDDWLLSNYHTRSWNIKAKQIVFNQGWQWSFSSTADDLYLPFGRDLDAYLRVHERTFSLATANELTIPFYAPRNIARGYWICVRRWFGCRLSVGGDGIFYGATLAIILTDATRMQTIIK